MDWSIIMTAIKITSNKVFTVCNMTSSALGNHAVLQCAPFVSLTEMSDGPSDLVPLVICDTRFQNIEAQPVLRIPPPSPC